MAQDVSNNELYRIINRALAKWGSFDDVPADREIDIFCHKYEMRKRNHPQLDIFEDSLPSPEDVVSAKQLCTDIEIYRTALDIDADQDIELTEDFYRRLYRGIEKYSAHISKDNQIRYDILKQNLQRHLPEFAENVLLNQYNQEINTIEFLKKNRKKECAMKALVFFNQITTRKTELTDKIKKLSASSDKIAFCEKCINIVDCLPQEKYNRTAKFTLKRNLYNLISDTAQEIGGSYIKTAKTALNEAIRYQKSIDNAKQYFQKTKRRTFDIEARNRRAMEEWLYK